MPPLANSSIGRAEVNASNQSDKDRIHEDPTSSSAQAQMLLTALRNFIIPLVQMAVPNVKDLHRVPLGPEAGDFLAALQKYIGSIVQDQSKSQSDIKGGVKRTVNLEVLTVMASKKRQQESHNKGAIVHLENSSAGGVNLSQSTYIQEEASVIPQNLHHEEPDYREILLSRALPILRARVFNTLPIRLLYFKKHKSSLDITLLDRTGIYSHLALKLRSRFFAPNYSRLMSSEAASEWVRKLTMYTILSHTWLRSSPGEVTYDDWHQGTFDLSHPGYRKLVDFCEVAAEKHGVGLGWMDTVCINKESSAELDESIRSMYKWYQNAKNCIVYLAETTGLSDMATDPWFTRGWTLQELLAPKYITFYGADWTILGSGLFNDKDDPDIQSRIELATTITPTELLSSLSDTTISRKMQWAARRKVTRGEDTAYSLMGIFNVSISIAYGEGADLAFLRLVKEILNTAKSEVIDVFNWVGNYDTDISTLIPSSPAAYLGRREFDFGQMSLIEPLTLTHLALRIPVVLMPATPYRSNSRTPYTPKGDYSSVVRIDPVLFEHDALRDSFIVLGRSLYASPFSHSGESLGLAFAVLNCGGFSESHILLFKHCFAVAILYSHDKGIATPIGYKRKVPTRDPIVFQLYNNRRKRSHDDWEYDTVPKSELGRHGMQLLTMYL